MNLWSNTPLVLLPFKSQYLIFTLSSYIQLDAIKINLTQSSGLANPNCTVLQSLVLEKPHISSILVNEKENITAFIIDAIWKVHIFMNQVWQTSAYI